MNTKIALLGLLAGSGILICGCQTPRTADAWEYKVIEKNLYPGEVQKQIDSTVQQGWELVSLSTVGQGDSTVPHGFIVLRKLRR